MTLHGFHIPWNDEIMKSHLAVEQLLDTKMPPKKYTLNWIVSC